MSKTKRGCIYIVYLAVSASEIGRVDAVRTEIKVHSRVATRLCSAVINDPSDWIDNMIPT